MRFELKPPRSEIAQSARAGFDLENAIALAAVKVMMVRLASEFVTARGARQLDFLDHTLADHRLDIPVNRGDSQRRNLVLCRLLDLLRAQGPSRFGQGLADRVTLLGLALL